MAKLGQLSTELDHILTLVLEEEKDSSLHLSLQENAVYSLPLLVSFTYDEINKLRFTNSKGNQQHLQIGKTRKIINIKNYILHMDALGTPVTDYLSITKEDFEVFMASNYALFDRSNYPNFSSSTPKTSSTTSTPITTRSISAKAEFMKGIKRDITLFPTLKNEENWDQWNRSLQAIAHMQDVAVVLDERYAPSSPDEVELFKAKQEFMYTVFEHTILTSQGKDIVWHHEHDFDAQKIYQSLITYLKQSTKGLLASSCILSYITSASLTSDTWKGSAHDFLLHWKDQMHQYEKLVDIADKLTDNVKCVLLETAVHPLAELHQVKADSDQHYTCTGRPLTFAQYESLLVSAAITYDEQYCIKWRAHGRYLHLMYCQMHKLMMMIFL